MTRPLALGAKVVGGFHDPCPKKHRPPTIDGDACRQRLLRRNQPIGKVETIERLFIRTPRNLRQKSRHRRRNLIPILIVAPTDLDKGIARLVHLRHHHGVRHRLLNVSLGFFEIIDFLREDPRIRSQLLQKNRENLLLLLRTTQLWLGFQ